MVPLLTDLCDPYYSLQFLDLEEPRDTPDLVNCFPFSNTT